MPMNCRGEEFGTCFAAEWQGSTFKENRMFVFFSNRLGCFGSIVASLVGSAILVALMYSCSAR